MQTRRQGTIIFVTAVSPARPIQDALETHGLTVQWARSIALAECFLQKSIEHTVIVTELALPDGNWRDLVERTRCLGRHIPIVLLTPASTPELWWDALECGVEEILPKSCAASQLRQLLERLGE